MKKRLLFLAPILATMLLAAACTSAEEEANTKLSISVGSDSAGYYENAIEGFKEIHPDVEIVLNNYRGDFEKYRQQVGIQLMAGEADDLLFFYGLDSPKFFDSGLMADFYPIMQNDPDFNAADYYTSVFNGYAYGNKLLIFPVNFTYQVIAVNDNFSPQLTEKFVQFDKITYSELYDLYYGLEDKSRVYISKTTDAHVAIERNISTYVDFVNKKCYFNTPEFIEFITKIKNGTDPQKIADGELGYSYGYGGALGLLEQPDHALKYLFCDDMCVVDMYLIPDCEEKKFTHYIPLVRENGTLMALPLDAFVISKASKNKELAWEFIKYLAATEAQGFYLREFNVNKQLFSAYVNIMIRRNTGDIARVLGEFEPLETSEQILARLEAYSEMPIEFITDFMYDEIREIMQSFYDGFLTAEQAASELQNKVSLYLME